MAIKDWCEICSIMIVPFLLILMLVSILVGIIGTAEYVPEKHDESVYKRTTCLVKNYTRFGKICSSQSCTGSGSDEICTTDYYTCHVEVYTVLYNVSSLGTIETSFVSSDGPGSNSVRITLRF